MTTTTAPPAQRLAELQAFVATLAADPDWRQAWNVRHDSPDGWESPIRIANAILAGMAAAIDRGDLAGLDARERYLRRVVDGAEWAAGLSRVSRPRSVLMVGGKRYMGQS